MVTSTYAPNPHGFVALWNMTNTFVTIIIGGKSKRLTSECQHISEKEDHIYHSTIASYYMRSLCTRCPVYVSNRKTTKLSIK